MQAKVYAPTIAQREEGLRLEERFWTRGLFLRLALYSSIPLIVAWHSAGFTVPFSVDRQDLIIGAITAMVGELFAFFDKKGRAKWHAEDHEEAAKQLGPMQYRLTEAGVDIWARGEHDHYAWNTFERFKLTGDLLLLSRSGPGGGYWVFPRAEVGEELLSRVLRALDEGGAVRVADR